MQHIKKAVFYWKGGRRYCRLHGYARRGATKYLTHVELITGEEGLAADPEGFWDGLDLPPVVVR